MFSLHFSIYYSLYYYYIYLCLGGKDRGIQILHTEFSAEYWKTCLSYFTLYYSWTHHRSRALCLSRELQIAPSGSQPLWSSLCVASTIISCTTFKTHSLCFAICSAWHHYYPPASTPPLVLHPRGSPLSLAFSTTSREAIRVCVNACFLFNVQSLFILANEQRMNGMCLHLIP